MILLHKIRLLNFTHTQLRNIYSKTGKWKKKINKTALLDLENHWREKVLSPPNPILKASSTKDGTSEISNKMYILSMFPYPSGDLHMGHMRVYTISDVLARYHRLNGKHVIHPIGWDAFGLPAENAAIDRGLAPRSWTESNIERMRGQLKDLRISFDWQREIFTCNPEYYRWTQWIFLLMYKRGLAYSMKEAVNWDPVDETVLADEQIDSEGNSWRSGAKVEKKYLTQWYLRATNFTQSLLDGLDSLDPEHCQGFSNAQRSWMGAPTGVKVTVKAQPGDEILSVFTETPELMCGVDFLQISPSHPLASSNNTSCGLLPELCMINPLTSESVPIVIQDSPVFTDKNKTRFGISSLYDSDADTVTKYNLNRKPSVLDSQSHIQNSTSDLNGLDQVAAREKVNQDLSDNHLGGHLTSSEMKDWLISRQRYWGTPIPIVHCDKCGTVPVRETDLPVLLPDITELTRRGGNPLTNTHEWRDTTCPSCGGSAQRETDTMDTFVDSAWYYLRYTDPHNESQPFSTQTANQMMPVDVYIGGAEHAILHMYFARFLSHFFYSEGMTSHREPFTLQLALGVVHSDCYKNAKTGEYLYKSKVKHEDDRIVVKSTGDPAIHTIEKMSKSKHNGVNPADVLKQHGVDQTRLYMLANSSPKAKKHWNPDLVKLLMFPVGKPISIPRWMHTLWHTVSIIRQRREALSADQLTDIDIDTETQDLLYNYRNENTTTVSTCLGHPFNLHDAINCLYHITYEADKVSFDAKLFSSHFENYFADFLILLHPFAPHVTAELWEGLRTSPRLITNNYRHDWDSDIFSQEWPELSLDYPVKLVITSPSDNSQQESEDITHDDYQDTEQPETEELETESEDSDASHNPQHQRIQASLKLPYEAIRSLDVEKALQIALDSGYIIQNIDSVQNSGDASQSKLRLKENGGATLTLGSDFSLLRRQEEKTLECDKERTTTHC